MRHLQMKDCHSILIYVIVGFPVVPLLFSFCKSIPLPAALENKYSTHINNLYFGYFRQVILYLNFNRDNSSKAYM
jgi:hypothetical protein